MKTRYFSIVLPLLLLSLFLNPQSIYSAGEPNDITMVKRLFSLIEETTSEGEIGNNIIAPLFISTLSSNCVKTAKTSGVTNITKQDWTRLNRIIEKHVDKMVDKIPVEGDTRLKTLKHIGRLVSSRRLANKLVAKWLGHNSSEKIKFIDENSSSTIALLFSKQLSSFSGEKQRISFFPENSSLVEEIGGVGDGNGLAEIGEWVKINFSLKNSDNKAWFSTSGFFSTRDSYCYIKTDKEILLGELHQPNSSTALSEWIYISRSTPKNHSIRLNLDIQDTWRTKVKPLSITINVKPIFVATPKSNNVKLDCDLPGSSDGSLKRELEPELKFEYIESFSTSLKPVKKASVKYHIPLDLHKMVKIDLTDPVLIVSPNGILLMPNDDIDGEVSSSSVMKQSVKNLSLSKAWFPNGLKGRLWLATDIDVWIPHSESNTTIIEKSISCAEWPKSATVLKLIHKHNKLFAHPIKPILPNGTVASSGVEVVFNSTGFAKDYDSLYPKAELPDTIVKEGFLHYRYRTYKDMPVMAMLHTPVRKKRRVYKRYVEPSKEEIIYNYYDNRLFIQPLALTFPNGIGFTIGYDRKLEETKSILGIFQFNYAQSNSISSSYPVFPEKINYDINVYNFGIGYRSYTKRSRENPYIQPYFQTMVKIGNATYSYQDSLYTRQNTARGTFSALLSGGINVNADHFYLTFDAGPGLAYIHESNVTPEGRILEHPSTAANGTGYYTYKKDILGLNDWYLVFDLNLAIGFQW